jgi:hypothetical protein
MIDLDACDVKANCSPEFWHEAVLRASAPWATLSRVARVIGVKQQMLHR